MYRKGAKNHIIFGSQIAQAVKWDYGLRTHEMNKNIQQ